MFYLKEFIVEFIVISHIYHLQLYNSLAKLWRAQFSFTNFINNGAKIAVQTLMFKFRCWNKRGKLLLLSHKGHFIVLPKSMEENNKRNMEIIREDRVKFLVCLSKARISQQNHIICMNTEKQLKTDVNLKVCKFSFFPT